MPGFLVFIRRCNCGTFVKDGESFCGDIIFEYQHAGGDSPEVKSSVKTLAMEEPFPSNNQGVAGEEFPLELKDFPSKVRKTRSSPSHGRRIRSTRSLQRRRQFRVIQDTEENPFADKTVRRAFNRKLYSMLTLQLGLTVGIICLFVYWSYLRIWVRRRPWFCYALLPAMLIMAIALACCDHARRKFPLNIILLFIFTVLKGTLLGSITTFFELDPVMWAVGSTAFVTLGLAIFALQTKWDLTITAGVLLTLFFVVIHFGILCAIIQSMWIQIIYASVGSLIFGIYLVVDTQLMLGKKHHYILKPEEYIFAVLNLYIDIINLCLAVLKFVGFLK